MASTQLAVVRADDEDLNFEGMIPEAARDLLDDLRAEIDNLKADNEGLQDHVSLLRGLVERSAAAHQATNGRLAYAEESLALARETANLWEDLYAASETSKRWTGRVVGLVVGMTSLLAGASAYLLAVAQLVQGGGR